MWLTRHISEEVSSVLFFTSHFYSTLMNEKLGLQHVSGWVQQRKLDIFSKQIIVFPINGDSHWSLLVAYYPGLVRQSGGTESTGVADRVPIILHLDSLQYHNGYKIGNNIRNFFNYEWSNKKGSSQGNIFTDMAYPVIIPKGMYIIILLLFFLLSSFTSVISKYFFFHSTTAEKWVRLRSFYLSICVCYF
jgi:Ulp1 family protease